MHPGTDFWGNVALENQLNPTLVDGLWPWRQHLSEAAMVVSTLVREETVAAARELARELAQSDRTVVVTGAGATEPLFWHVPAGRQLDTVRPDLVLLLVRNQFSASSRLLLATAHKVILLTGTGPEAQVESLRAMQLIIKTASPSHVEVVVVADRPETAREIGTNLAGMAKSRFGDRTSWRHLPAQSIADAVRSTEEGKMASTKPRPVPFSEAELRAKEWEESFRRAEKLLQEAQATLRRQLERSAAPAQSAPAGTATRSRARAV